MSWCWTIATMISLTCNFLGPVQSIEYGISTQPDDLGFEKFVDFSSETRSVFFIQPTKSGFIEATIGGVESRHDYNMSSIAVFLSSHLVTMQGNFISDLFALCSVENAHLVAKNKAILLCQFDVSMPSYDGYVFSSSSCLIHCAKETECAAKIDLGFLRRQAQISVPDKSELIISYNITALDVKSLNPHGQIMERDDVTNSLIYKHMKLPSVYIQRRPDTEFSTLLTDENGYPSIQLEAPRISSSKYFDLVILQTSPTSIWKMKLKFVFSSQLRFLWAKEEEEGGAWKLQGTPSPHGLTVKLRQRTFPHLHSSTLTGSDASSDSLPSHSLEDALLHQRTATQIGVLRFERVLMKTSRPTSTVVEPFTHLPTSLPHLNEIDEEGEIEEAEEADVIKVRVTSIDWPKNLANATKMTDTKGRLVRLPIPETLPDPNSMHIFVQFQPADILEPPWSPSREPPPPRQLKVLGLLPPSASATVRAYPPAFRSHFEITGLQSAGRLIPLTNKVYCRTVTHNAVGVLAATLPMLHRQQSTCPFQMREAPVELEVNPPLGDASGSGKILLGLQDTPGGLPIVADVLHAPPQSRITAPWSWRAWLGPTVRRWHFENFNIRLQSDKLRRISNFPISGDSIFTTLPDTGERMYLSDIRPRGMSLEDVTGGEYDHLSHRPAELDVTHLLPSWSLRLRPFPSTSEFSATTSKSPAVIFRNKRSLHPFLIGQHEGHVRIELIAAPKDSQPLAHKDVSIVASEKNDLVRLKVECISWMITLSGRLEPHPSAEVLLRSSTEPYGGTAADEESAQTLLLPNEREMIADFAAHPHPRVLNLIVRGQDPTDVHVIAAQVISGDLQNITSATQNVFCPLGKLAISVILEDGSEMGLHWLPEGQIRVSGLLQSTKRTVVWDPAKPLLIAPVTEEGKALVAAGKIGHGPMIDVKSIALWTGQPACSPKPSLFLPDTRPLIAISVGLLNDPGPPDQTIDWEQEALEKFRRSTGPTSIGAFDYGRSHFLVPRDSQVTEAHNFTAAQSSLFSTPMKYTLFGVIIFSAIFLTVGCLALVIVRHRKTVRRRKARIEENPNSPVVLGGEGGKSGDAIYPISPQLSSTTAATAATMNPGLSCSSVFSGGSGGVCTPAQTAELINQWTGRQPSSMLPPQQCSSCSNSVGTRSPQSDAVHNDLRTGGVVDMRYQVANQTLKLDSAQRGLMSPSSPNFSSKWRAPESLGSAPSSRNTGSPSTNDEGFASGPPEMPSKRHMYCNTTPRLESGTWGLTVGGSLQPSCSCQTASPHTSHHSSDLVRGSTCTNTCYLPGGYMGTSMAADNARFYGAPSGMASDSMPPRLTLAHDPESIGVGKYMSKLNQLPPSLLLPTEMLKMETSQIAGGGFIGDTTEEKLLMDSGRESQDKTSSSGASSGLNKDFSSMSGIEIAQVDV